MVDPAPPSCSCNTFYIPIHLGRLHFRRCTNGNAALNAAPFPTRGTSTFWPKVDQIYELCGCSCHFIIFFGNLLAFPHFPKLKVLKKCSFSPWSKHPQKNLHPKKSRRRFYRAGGFLENDGKWQMDTNGGGFNKKQQISIHELILSYSSIRVRQFIHRTVIIFHSLTVCFLLNFNHSHDTSNSYG